ANAQVVDHLLDAVHAPGGRLGLGFLRRRIDLATQVDGVLVRVDVDAARRAPVIGGDASSDGAGDDLVVDVGAEGPPGERATAEHHAEQDERAAAPEHQIVPRHQTGVIASATPGSPQAFARGLPGEPRQAAAGRMAARSLSRRSTDCQSTLRKNASMYCAFSVAL